MSIELDLTVVRVNQQTQSCGAQSANEILIEFELPEAPEILLGDALTIAEFQMDSDVSVVHTPTQQTFRAFIDSKDVHDLRIPASLGGSRTPTLERIGGD